MADLELKKGERVLEERDLVEGETLVSDGNSRWVEQDDKRYFVVTKDYLSPEEDA